MSGSSVVCVALQDGGRCAVSVGQTFISFGSSTDVRSEYCLVLNGTLTACEVT